MPTIEEAYSRGYHTADLLEAHIEKPGFTVLSQQCRKQNSLTHLHPATVLDQHDALHQIEKEEATIGRIADGVNGGQLM